MYNNTRRSTSLSICIPGEDEEVKLNEEFDNSYIINPECEIIPAFSTIHTFRAETVLHSNMQYFLTMDVCYRNRGDKVAIKKELQNALSGNFLISYSNINNLIFTTRNTINIPSFIGRSDSRINRLGITYFRYRSDIFA